MATPKPRLSPLEKLKKAANLQPIKREVELTPEQQTHYKQMKSQALTALKGKIISAPHVLTQLMRLHQITCGHLKLDDGTTEDIKNNRLNELMDVLEEVEG